MRKYIRKKVEYNLIEGVHELCRLCLGNTEKSVPIFTDNQDNLCVTLALRIMMCIGVEVTRDESLPNKVCKECCNQLEQYYTFKKKCMFTYQKLKSHLSAIKETPLNIYNTNNVKENSQDLTALNNNVDLKLKSLEPALNKSVDSKKNNQNIVNLEKQNQDCISVQELEKEQNECGVVEDQLVLILNDDQQVFIVNKESNSSTNYSALNDVKKSENSLTILNKTCHQVEEVDQNTGTKPEFSDTQISLASTSILKPPEANLSSVLSTMLLELGILVPDGDNISVADSRMIQLETADGNNVMIQLEEEDEEQESPQQTFEVQNNVDETENIAGIQSFSLKKYNNVTVSKACNTVCSVCGKALSSRGALWRHVREVHERARPHTCRSCGRGFAQLAVLRRHELVHQELRPHKCAVCSRSFTQASALAQHARSHVSAEARALTLHCCQLCDKLFLYASGLSRHMLRHKGREYACVRCGRHFGDRSSLLRHMRRAGHVDETQHERNT